MCACGRQRNQVATSVQAAQDLADQQAAERALYEGAVDGVLSGAEQLARSAAAAIGNSATR